jgi:para-nitrobenzyl esterase
MNGSSVPIAHTLSGDLRGIQLDGGVQFRGVPYAAPPVGELRFAPPREVAAWSGVRAADQHGPIAPQLPSRLRTVMGDFERQWSEDCLTLTISTSAADTGARPVLVWLHGGAYLTGAGSLDWYDGMRLAEAGDVVVVGVNYRLGALGFLCYPGLSDGTLGVRDVAAALGWIQDNIGAFGGDPKRVTLMGQSAGASIITYLLARGRAPGLFQRAILQSPHTGVPPFTRAFAQERAESLLDLLGIDRSDPAAVPARLRAEPVERILDATGQLARATAGFGRVTPPLLPVFDDLATPADLIAAAARGAGAAAIDLIVGTTREEANAFLVYDPAMQDPDPAQVTERFAALGGDANAIEQYRRRRPGVGLRALLSDLLTDHRFLLASLQFAEAATNAGARAWVYQFDWSPSESPLGACHCIELPFVFGNLDAWPGAAMLDGADPAMVAALSATIQAAWLAFVKTGDPTSGVLWPPYLPAGRQTMQFGAVVGPVGDLAGLAWRTGLAATGEGTAAHGR